MSKTVVITILILSTICAPAMAQHWQAQSLGPGSQPGTIIIEVTGQGATGTYCPQPCEVDESYLAIRLSPCAWITGVDYNDHSKCASEDIAQSKLSTSVSEPFSFQFEANETVTYTIEGWFWQWVYREKDESGRCLQTGRCGDFVVMQPEPLTIDGKVANRKSGWSVLKARYDDR